MAFIKDSDQGVIREKLRPMGGAVTLRFFTQEVECDFCRETRELLEELRALDGRLRLAVFDFKSDAEVALRCGVDKIPATVVANSRDYGIRFYGIPAGYEFSSLLEAIVMVSRGESGLAQESKSLLRGITSPVHLQVFVTPT